MRICKIFAAGARASATRRPPWRLPCGAAYTAMGRARHRPGHPLKGRCALHLGCESCMGCPACLLGRRAWPRAPGLGGRRCKTLWSFKAYEIFDFPVVFLRNPMKNPWQKQRKTMATIHRSQDNIGTPKCNAKVATLRKKICNIFHQKIQRTATIRH